MFKTVVLSLSLTVLVSFLWHSTLPLAAQVRQSTNYRIQSDSINFGGGLSSSTNYELESTAGEIATGPSNSTNYIVNAGYQQMQVVYVALTGASDVILSPAIGGLTGGTSNGSTTIRVTTDSPAGYQLTIEAENNPAMQDGANTIADYAPVGAVPDYSFDTANTEAHFGYSPDGVDLVARFLDDDVDTCGGGGSVDGKLTCWDGLSTTAETISQGSGSNHPDGATTTVNFRVGVGDTVGQAPGVYYATTTITAVAL